MVMCRLLVLVGAMALASADAFAQAPPRESTPQEIHVASFGKIHITRYPANDTYVLTIWSDTSADNAAMNVRIGIQCHRTDFTLTLGLPPHANYRFRNPEKFAFWSDRSSPVDVTIYTAGGVFAMAMSVSAEDGADAVKAILTTIFSGERNFSFSVGRHTATFDLTHMKAARARFSNLCQRL